MATPKYVPPRTPVRPTSAPPRAAEPTTASDMEQVINLTRKFVVNAWAVVEDKHCSPNLETKPICNYDGLFGDFYYDEDRSAEIEVNNVKAYLPAHVGTYKWIVKVPVPLPKDLENHTWVVLGIQHDGDGTNDQYWFAKAAEELQRWDESREEQAEIDRRNREADLD